MSQESLLENGQSIELKNRSMNEKQTLDFLQSKGVQPMEDQCLRPGQPFLFLLGETIRTKSLKNFTPDRKPSIALVLNPLIFNSDSTGVTSFENRGEIIYYAINSKTREVVEVKRSNEAKGYNVIDGDIFQPNNDIFPPDSKII
ncbi:MAG: hypothetical protein WCI76_02020 [bacterium]